MAQTGYTPISIYYSATATNVPTAGNLVAGELALNTADGKLFYKDSSNVVQVIGTKGGVGTSSTTQVLYNSSGLVVGSANLTFNGTTLTTANDASISGLTVGKGGGAVANNTAVGLNALIANTSGSDNTAIGLNTLKTSTTGTSNFAGARDALFSNTTGSSNTALGTQSLYFNTTASNNTAVGYQAGYSCTAGGGNTFVGYQAGYTFSGGSGNTYFNACFGVNAGYALGSGVYGHTFVGANAGSAITTGLNNTIIGAYGGNSGGLDIRTASNYIVLSDGAGNPRGVFDGSGNLLVGCTDVTTTVSTGTRIRATGAVYSTLSGTTNATETFGVYSTGAGAYRFYVDMAGTVHATSIVISAISDERLKENIKDIDTGLDSVMALKPRRFDWKEGKGQDKKNAAGFIAQEFETVFPESVGLSKAGGDGIEYKDINHETLIPTLVKAIQEQQALIESLTTRLTILEAK